ncbi:folate-sensitive fragile site protein Fra10Ac1-domain-containing protein [Chlamydoabsidia padenii]|nr:folate-sensitive fragile site protein Fra10Ac1-domain-containing protein [Chlamydoabsidia padenii]
MGKFVFSKELRGVDAYTRHKKLLRGYESYKGAVASRTHAHNPEYDILRKHHKFILSSVDNTDDSTMTWEQRLAKKYYDQLFKEYALCELSRYKHGQIALRWRTENEVVMGKGQFICAACEETDDLTSWEVNFGYLEDGMKKNELVKVRLCPGCSDKLNYKTQKRRTKKMEKGITHGKRKRRYSNDDDGSDSDASSHKRKRRSGSNGHSDHEGDDYDNDKSSSEKHNASSIWTKDWDDKDDKTKDEEFEDYFADLLQ